MSGWLLSVGKVLERLDDGVQNVVEDGTDQLTRRANQFLGGGGDEDEYEYYEDGEYYEEYEEGEEYVEQGEEEISDGELVSADVGTSTNDSEEGIMVNASDDSRSTPTEPVVPEKALPPDQSGAAHELQKDANSIKDPEAPSAPLSEPDPRPTATAVDTQSTPAVGISSEDSQQPASKSASQAVVKSSARSKALPLPPTHVSKASANASQGSTGNDASKPPVQAPSGPVALEKKSAPPAPVAESESAKSAPKATPPPTKKQSSQKSAQGASGGGKFPTPPPPPPRSDNNKNRSSAAPPSSGSKQQRPQRTKVSTTPPNTAEQLRLEKQNQQLQAELEAVQAELQAQHKELSQAAQQLQDLRQQHKEELDEAYDEQDEELQALKKEHQDELEEQREHFEAQLAAVQEQLNSEQTRRAQEGGDLTLELEALVQREKAALQQMQSTETDKSVLEARIAELDSELAALKTQHESQVSAAKAAVEGHAQAEERLDAAMKQHKHAISQRQAREAQLERTVADLGAALAELQASSREQQTPHAEESASSWKAQYEALSEELGHVQSQLTLYQQRCESLAGDMEEMTRERASEIERAQEALLVSDQQASEQAARIRELEAALHEWTGGDSADRLRQAEREADSAKQQLASLSDQLVRQQSLVESSKSEVLALKGRLQSANARADAAEQQAVTAASAASTLPNEESTRLFYETESGGAASQEPVAYGSASKMRRRIKGGAGSNEGGLAIGSGFRSGGMNPPPSGPPKSLRAALGLRVVASSQQGGPLALIMKACDTLDLCMIHLSSVLRDEPLSRLGLAVYLTLLHLWCWGLVFFHAVESEHADLGALAERHAVHAIGAHAKVQPVTTGAN